ncbi:MAG: hypothetical protein NVS9B12_10540 [Vulcanimicrobiaceae bacterium]
MAVTVIVVVAVMRMIVFVLGSIGVVVFVLMVVIVFVRVVGFRVHVLVRRTAFVRVLMLVFHGCSSFACCREAYRFAIAGFLSA